MKEQFPLSDISAISVSSLSDGVMVIGLPTEGPNARGDLIIKTEQVIELVTKLALFGGKLDTVKIVSTGTWVTEFHCLLFPRENKKEKENSVVKTGHVIARS